jgi:hypothetical protein
VPTNRKAADAPGDNQEPSHATNGSSGGRPSEQRTEVLSSNENNAVRLKESAYALFAWASMRTDLKGLDAEAYQLYRDRLLADAGSPTDPIEAMILEQLALAHLNVGVFQYRATNAGTIQATAAYAGAAARLIAEFRRSALALQAYRVASRQLANDPSKDIVVPVEQAEACEALPGKKDLDNEEPLIKEPADGGDPIIPYPGPAAFHDQEPQSSDAARTRSGRKGKGPRRNSDNQAVGEVHRAANS